MKPFEFNKHTVGMVHLGDIKFGDLAANTD